MLYKYDHPNNDRDNFVVLYSEPILAGDQIEIDPSFCITTSVKNLNEFLSLSL